MLIVIDDFDPILHLLKVTGHLTGISIVLIATFWGCEVCCALSSDSDPSDTWASIKNQ